MSGSPHSDSKPPAMLELSDISFERTARKRSATFSVKIGNRKSEIEVSLGLLRMAAFLDMLLHRRPAPLRHRRPSYQSVQVERCLRFSPRCRRVFHNIPRCSRNE